MQPTTMMMEAHLSGSPRVSTEDMISSLPTDEDCGSSNESSWSSDDDDSTQISSPLLLGDDDESECDEAEKEDRFTELPSLHWLDASEAQRQTVLGREALQSGDLDKARELLSKALVLYKRSFPKTTNGKHQRCAVVVPPLCHPRALDYATTLRYLAAVVRRQARQQRVPLEQARQYLLVALEIVREMGQDHETALTLYELGRVCHTHWEKRAQSYYRVALSMYETSEDLWDDGAVQMAQILHHWGRLIRTTVSPAEDFQKARQCQQRAWSLVTLMTPTMMMSDTHSSLVEDIEQELVKLSTTRLVQKSNSLDHMRSSGDQIWMMLLVFLMIMMVVCCLHIQI